MAKKSLLHNFDPSFLAYRKTSRVRTVVVLVFCAHLWEIFNGGRNSKHLALSDVYPLAVAVVFSCRGKKHEHPCVLKNLYIRTYTPRVFLLNLFLLPWEMSAKFFSLQLISQHSKM